MVVFSNCRLFLFVRKVNNVGENQIGDEGMVFLHNFPQLKNLYIQKTGITGKGVEILTKGNLSLQVLDLSQ